MFRYRNVLYIVDFRRYGKRLAGPARSAARGRGAQVILVANSWLSPNPGHVRGIVAGPVGSVTVWVSHCPAVAMTEAIVACVVDRSWDAAPQPTNARDGLRLQQDPEQDEN